jgi:hypothetical protein
MSFFKSSESARPTTATKSDSKSSNGKGQKKSKTISLSEFTGTNVSYTGSSNNGARGIDHRFTSGDQVSAAAGGGGNFTKFLDSQPVKDTAASREIYISKFLFKFVKLCKTAGITSTKVIDDIVYKFFGIQKKDDAQATSDTDYKAPSKDQDSEEVEDDQEFAKHMASTQGSVQDVSEDVHDDQMTPSDITTASLIIVTMIQYRLIHKNDIEKLPEELASEIIKDHQALSSQTPAFEFPPNAKIAPEFIRNMTNLAVLPQRFNIEAEALVDIFNRHVEASKLIGMIDIKEDGFTGCTSPMKCNIAINQGKIISFTRADANKYRVAFLSASSDVALGQFPKEIKFLPKFIHNILKKLPTFGDVFLSIQDSSNIDEIKKFIETDVGKYLIGAEIKPSIKYVDFIVALTSRILEGIHSTAINRNSRSPENCIVANRHRSIFPVVFSDYHMKLAKFYADDADQFFSISKGIKDFRYLNISIEMAMIATLIMSSVGTECLQRLEESLAAYYTNISRPENESVDEKKQRINLANSSLYNVIHCLNDILHSEVCTQVLTKEEFAILNEWILCARDLFPKNGERKPHDRRHGKKHEQSSDPSEEHEDHVDRYQISHSTAPIAAAATKQNEFESMFPCAMTATRQEPILAPPKKEKKVPKAWGPIAEDVVA